MHRTVRIALSLCLILPPADLVAETGLQKRLDAVLERLASTGAVIHARVIELPGGRELYAKRPDAPCIPASNFKLLTSAAGLDMFGPRYTFKTWLAVDDRDLWVIGSGDPGTGDPRLAKARGETPTTMFERWAEALRSRGLVRIEGDLVFDDSALEKLQVHPTWPKGWLLHWYAAPVSGLNFNDGCVDISVAPGEDDKPVRYTVMPPIADISVTNECLSGGKGVPSIVKLTGGNKYRIRGACSRPAELMSKPVEDPGAFFADALRTHLAAKGITIAGTIRRAERPLGGRIPPPQEKIVATHETPITDVLSRVNKNSQNLFAECLCKLTGQAFEAKQGRQVPGSWESGGRALHAFLQKSGIDDRGLEPVDGSGLSPANRTTTRMLTELLRVMFSRPDAEVYRASLTIAGVDGSLKDRMDGLKGRVYGKTGYIGGVSSTSGYLRTDAGRWLAFSFIYNAIPQRADSDADTADFTKLQDEACRVLAGWTGAEIE